MSWSRSRSWNRRQRAPGKAPHQSWNIQEDIAQRGRINNIWPGVQKAVVVHQALEPSLSQAAWKVEVRGQLEELWSDTFKRSIPGSC